MTELSNIQQLSRIKYQAVINFSANVFLKDKFTWFQLKVYFIFLHTKIDITGYRFKMEIVDFQRSK